MTAKFWKSSRLMMTGSWIAAVSLLTLTPLGCNAAKPPVTAPSMAQGSMMKQTTSGGFVSVEHKTTGALSLVTEGNQRYLVLDKNFKTSAGPDLFVILHQSSPPKRYGKNSYVLLGKLQNVSGEQRYAIPTTINLKSYKSAVIWCRQFSATFAYAPLP
jgi:Electron transfer DM13